MTRHHRWTDDERAVIRSLRQPEHGRIASQPQVAAVFGVTVRVLRIEMTKMGLICAERRCDARGYSAAEVARAAKLRRHGLTWAQIAAALGRPVPSLVSRRVRAAYPDLPRDKRGQASGRPAP